MRIIAGEFRGRKLLPPKGETTRPITDRVKQSVFDVLREQIPDAIVLDLFAGTGSLGLEALSRGAQQAVFFEADASAASILRRNISALGVEDRSKVFAADAFAAPSRGELSTIASKCTLCFLDPPYRFLSERPSDLQQLALRITDKLLASGAVVVFRHARSGILELPPLQRYDIREYGEMTVEFLIRP